ncbi:hypothetical protein GQ55_5G265300 [Panicum hallii var. hallii]|uniref:cysteine dioxygenase n=1 Tax=Panicum hallii var. hallii TaxID=1504633 RepID=A0A2T7DKE5_9POAL|nr:hypothetical protein GQ55_5G265300 [Panicum hallii var. hallii]
MPLQGSKVAGKPASLVASSSSNRRRRRRVNRSMSSSMIWTPTNSTTSTIQKIYDISRDVFAAATPGFVPPPSDVERLTGFLDSLTLQDIGLDATMACFTENPQDHPKVTYVHFANSPTLSLCVFCFPQSAVIPLHDHPGMTVFSKILLGSMHIKSYDWVTASSSNQVTRMPNGARLAKLNTDAIFDATSKTVVLYPEDGGNLHCFNAMSPCAVLDVMGPPYCLEEGRDCSYFDSEAVHAGGDGQYAWLNKVPRTIEMNGFPMHLNIQM